jgi:Zn finger protein HypA/HybF involved in hydrogenase expression
MPGTFPARRRLTNWGREIMQEVVVTRDTKMLKTAGKTIAGVPGALECKQCHHPVSDDETVAYHLVDKILYGWCPSCFGHRHTVSAPLLGEIPS